MKVIIAGSREIVDLDIDAVVKMSGYEVAEVVCGMCRGVDMLGRAWAKSKGIPVKEFPADWDQFGRAAGPIRNGQMASYADALIAVMIPESRGTLNMIKTMRKEVLKDVYVLIATDDGYREKPGVQEEKSV